MEIFKKFNKAINLVIVFIMVVTSVLSSGSTAIARAAAVNISNKNLTLEVGKSETLTIKGTKSEISWSSNKKTVATVNSSGKVTAKKAGTATITATVNNKKYTCKVVAFVGKKITSGKISYIIPNDWKTNILSQQGNNYLVMAYPKSADMNTGSSNVNIVINETGTEKPDYSTVKELFEAQVTEDIIEAQLTQTGLVPDIQNFKTSDYESALGTAYMIQYDVNYKSDKESGTFSQILYDLYIDNYLIQVTITDDGKSVTPDVYSVGEYLLNSVKVVE